MRRSTANHVEEFDRIAPNQSIDQPRPRNSCPFCEDLSQKSHLCIFSENTNIIKGRYKFFTKWFCFKNGLRNCLLRLTTDRSHLISFQIISTCRGESTVVSWVNFYSRNLCENRLKVSCPSEVFSWHWYCPCGCVLKRPVIDIHLYYLLLIIDLLNTGWIFFITIACLVI